MVLLLLCQTKKMGLSLALEQRANGKCELCSTADTLDGFTVPPKNGDDLEVSIAICTTCQSQIENMDNLDPNHWRCLNESMWSEEIPVKVMSYKLLASLKEDWSDDLLAMLYLEESDMEWAQAGLASDGDVVHKDSNGNILKAGDSVVLIKDLNVKGANFVAKRGTAVRRISLVLDNPEHIEGRVNDQHIVILTKFVKKT